MTEQISSDGKWRERLLYAIEHSPQSYRQISIAAGLEQSYVFSIVKKNMAPTVDKMEAVCKALNISLYFVLTGNKLSSEAELLLEKYFQLPEKDRQFAVDLIDKISR